MAVLLVISGMGMVALGYGARWLHRQFGSYERLPHHFDIRGRPDAFGPPWVILRLLPTILGGALLTVTMLSVAAYDPTEQTALVAGNLIASASMAAAMALTAWLLSKWEKDGAKLDR